MEQSFDHFIRKLSKLPGLGSRSATRLMLHLLSHKESELNPLIDLLTHLKDNVTVCGQCNNLMLKEHHEYLCEICTNPKRDTETLCIVEQVGDLWAMERAGGYYGRYYVLGGALSVLDGIGPEELNLERLKKLIVTSSLKEIILATSMTTNGQTTAHYLHHLFADTQITISRIALGIPMGGELDYLDATTLNAALSDRRASP